MKTILLLSALLLSLALNLPISTSAQVTNASTVSDSTSPSLAATGLPALPANFFASVQSYLTSVDTNFTWVSNRLEAAAGGDYLGGIQWANYVSAQFDLSRWDFEGKVRNVGVAGAVESVEGGGGYTLIQDGSLKLQGSLLVGYDFSHDAALVEPQAVLKKKTTRNTYLELGVGLPLWLQKPLNDRPNFFIGAGFTY